MRRFAGDFEVLFVEGLPMRSLASADRIELRKAAQKLRRRARVRTEQPHLHVLSALPIPPAGRLGRATQLAVLRGQIELALRRLRLHGPVVSWFSIPIAAPLRSRLGDRGSLFYYQDRYDQFTGVDGPRLRRLTASLARECDVSIATSAELAEDLRRFGAEATVVGHGVDLERFAGEPEPPADLAELERPLVGYVGILDDYLSFEAVRAVAERLERGTVVLVGGVNTDVSILRHQRIVRLGFRPYESIPAYLAAFGCCIAPFRITPLTQAVNPIKLREYLAAGRPLVSTPLPAVLQYEDVVGLATTPEEFAGEVLRMLEPGRDTAEERRRRRESVRGDSWDAVAGRIRPKLLSLAGVPSVSDPPAQRS